jgi:uroporphyrinogen decarboxylase
MWFHPETARRLGDLLEIRPELVAQSFGDDVCQTWVGNNAAMEGIRHEREGETHVDDWGILWARVGEFNQVLRSPLAEAGGEECLAYRYPRKSKASLLTRLSRVLKTAGDRFVGCDISPCLFEMVCRLRGMEQAALDLAGDPGLAGRMLDAAATFAVELAHDACTAFPLDWLWTGDDVAGQSGLLMHPRVWRELVRPRLERIVGVGRSRGITVAHHCCGAMRDIIPDLIAMGVGVLNPVQSNCPGMDPLSLKAEFGRELTFMGGVDTVELLPHGSALEVRRATERLLEGMTADGGGYILAASHTIPPETPQENIFAMYAAAGVSRDEVRDRAADLRRADVLSV